MVGVAQLVESWIVAPVVAGSNPVAHPTDSSYNNGLLNKHFHLILLR